MFNYNPYFTPQMQPQAQRFQPMDQQFAQYNAQPQPIQQQPQYRQQNIGLQGKSVDSIEVVKAMDIPLDGSISYFPLTDGTAIISKQLQMDGTSKTIVYKPIETESENKKQTENVIPEKLSKEIAGIKESNVILKDDIDEIKSEIGDLSVNLNKILDEFKITKGGKK